MYQLLPVASIANALALTTPNPNQKTPTVSHVQIGTTFFFSVAVEISFLKKKKPTGLSRQRILLARNGQYF